MVFHKSWISLLRILSTWMNTLQSSGKGHWSGGSHVDNASYIMREERRKAGVRAPYEERIRLACNCGFLSSLLSNIYDFCRVRFLSILCNGQGQRRLLLIVLLSLGHRRQVKGYQYEEGDDDQVILLQVMTPLSHTEFNWLHKNR